MDMDLSFIPVRKTEYFHSYTNGPFQPKSSNNEREVPLPSLQAALTEPPQLRKHQIQRKAQTIQYDVPYSVVNKDMLVPVDEVLVIKQIKAGGVKEKISSVEPEHIIDVGTLEKSDVNKYLKGIKSLSSIAVDETKLHLISTSFLISFVMLQDRMHIPFDIVIRKQGNKYFLLPRVGSVADLVTCNETSHNDDHGSWMENTMVNDLFNTTYVPDYDVNKYSTDYMSVYFNHPKHNKSTVFPILHENAKSNMQAVSNVIKINANQLGRNAMSCILNGTDMQSLLVKKSTYEHSLMRLSVQECVTMMGLNEEKSWDFFVGWFLSVVAKVPNDGYFVITKEHRHSTKILSIPAEFVQRMVRQ